MSVSAIHLEGQNNPFDEAVENARSIKAICRYSDQILQDPHLVAPPMVSCGWNYDNLAKRYAPALGVASFDHKDVVLSVISITIAALTGFSSFFRWERTWRGNSTGQVSLEQHCAKWELELTNARLLLPAEERIEHVYRATDDLLTNARNVVSSENEGFFSHLQFPQQNTVPKV
jgi:hypothetical protein